MISCGFLYFRNQSTRSSSKDFKYFVRIKQPKTFTRTWLNKYLMAGYDNTNNIPSISLNVNIVLWSCQKNHNSPMNNLWRPNDRQSLIYSLHAALKVPIFTLDNDPRLYRAQCILWLILFDKYNTNHWTPPHLSLIRRWLRFIIIFTWYSNIYWIDIKWITVYIFHIINTTQSHNFSSE